MKRARQDKWPKLHPLLQLHTAGLCFRRHSRAFRATSSDNFYYSTVMNNYHYDNTLVAFKNMCVSAFGVGQSVLVCVAILWYVAVFVSGGLWVRFWRGLAGCRFCVLDFPNFL